MLLNSARSAVDSIGQATQEVNMTAVTKLGTTMIATRGLARTFKTRGGKVEAVRGVDLRVDAGEIFGFLGPNGAGKTTTLRMLATLLPPDGGRATVADHDLLREPARVRERIGYVGQAGGVDASATARENLVLQA